LLRLSLAVVGFLLGLGMALILGRGWIIEWQVGRMGRKLEARYGLQLAYQKLETQGLVGVRFRGLRVLPSAGDTLFRVDTLFVRPLFWPLLRGEVQLDQLEIGGGRVHLCLDSSKNRNWRVDTTKSENDEALAQQVQTNYHQKLGGLLESALSALPRALRLQDLHLRISLPADSLVAHIPSLRWTPGSRMEGQCLLNDALLSLSGDVRPNEPLIDAHIRVLSCPQDQAGEELPFTLPLLKSMFDLELGAAFAQLRLTNFERDSETVLGLEIKTRQAHLFHPKLSQEPVTVGELTFSPQIRLLEHALLLDTTTQLVVDGLALGIGISLGQADSGNVYGAQLRIPSQPAQLFFEALPAGLFPRLQGLRAEGQLAYRVDFRMESWQPDSLLFDAQMQPEGFRVLSYGALDLSAPQDTFWHQPWNSSRRRFIGRGNPAYTPLSQIDTVLQLSVINAEDGTFYFHNGFFPEGIRHAISTNFVEGEFARGGSTITQQLVKNLFLTPHKTVARKLEEALIVWMVERFQILSKRRILEIYLNIIEWGPDVYGIQEACQFYFNTTPQRLSIPQAIYLAMIIPSPRKFMYRFEGDTLRSFNQWFYNTLTSRLLRSGVIDSTAVDSVFSVTLTGPARQFLRGEAPAPEELEELLRQDQPDYRPAQPERRANPRQQGQPTVPSPNGGSMPVPSAAPPQPAVPPSFRPSGLP
jgi:hypothetical protein